MDDDYDEPTPEGYDEPASHASELDEAEEVIEDTVYFECPECEGSGCEECGETGERQCTHGNGHPVHCDICLAEMQARAAAWKIDHSR